MSTEYIEDQLFVNVSLMKQYIEVTELPHTKKHLIDKLNKLKKEYVSRGKIFDLLSRCPEENDDTGKEVREEKNQVYNWMGANDHILCKSFEELIAYYASKQSFNV